MTTPPLGTMRRYDPVAAAREIAAADPTFGELIDVVGLPDFETDTASTAHGARDVYRSLARSIVYQQLSGKAAATIFGRMVALFEPHEFPPPEALVEASDELLRTAGVSANKARALRDLAAKVLDGTVPDLAEADALDDAELIDRLVQVRGIGVWTVQMLLIFRLGRPDVLPVLDLGVRKGFQRVYGGRELPDAELLEVYAKYWQPWRSVASWYLWRATELPPEWAPTTRPPRRRRPRKAQR
jgi:3-methyladenine DNA glycosylase/8-oxoguanine DNA glycosylase